MPFAFGLDTLEPAFDDVPVPYISHGSRFHIAAAEHVNNTLGASKVYLIVEAALARNTPVALKRIQDSLGSKIVGTRIGMSSHTRWDEIIEIANDAAKVEPDCIITLGAGSLTDASKVIPWMLANDILTSEGLDTMWNGSPNQRHDLKPSVIRTIAIPTALSAGEYTSLSGVTRDDGTNKKCAFSPPTRNPSIVILDPELATTTSMRVWLSEGIRGVDHCIETLCSLHSTDTGDEKAREGLLKILPALLRTKNDPSDLDARFVSMMGTKDAIAAAASGVALGASHAIGHQLGPTGIKHGETSCIVLPAVCKWNAKQNANIDRQASCKRTILRNPEVRALVQEKSAEKTVEEMDLGDVLDVVIRQLGLPRTLRTVGISKDELDGIADNVLTDSWAATNPVPLTTKEQILEILEMAL